MSLKPMNKQAIIKDALAQIKEKTGIDFPFENVIYDYDRYFDYMYEEKGELIGGYYSHDDYIHLNPDIFKIDPTVIWTYRRLYKGGLVPRYKDTKKEMTEEEWIQSFLEIQALKAIETVAHEVGHWIHQKYFHRKAMYVRCCTNYAKTNSKENFAEAFAHYIVGNLKKDTAPYRRMQQICTTDLQNTRRWRLEHAV